MEVHSQNTIPVPVYQHMQAVRLGDEQSISIGPFLVYGLRKHHMLRLHLVYVFRFAFT